MKKYVINFVLADQQMTKIMQHVDLFEPWKVVLDSKVKDQISQGPVRYDLETEDWAQPETMIKTLSANPVFEGFLIIACWIDGCEEAFRDPNVKAVGNGEKWTTLDKYLKAYGFPQLVGQEV